MRPLPVDTKSQGFRVEDFGFRVQGFRMESLSQEPGSKRAEVLLFCLLLVKGLYVYIEFADQGLRVVIIWGLRVGCRRSRARG